MVSGARDNIVHVWNFKPNMRPFKFVGHKGVIHHVSFSPQGNLITSVGEDKIIRIWKNSVQAKCKEIKAHTGGIRETHFSNDQKFLLSGSDDKTLKVWNIPTYSLSGLLF